MDFAWLVIINYYYYDNDDNDNNLCLALKWPRTCALIEISGEARNQIQPNQV